MNMATVFSLISLVILHVASASLVNVAQGKPASMSSEYEDGSLQAGGAVDGNTSTVWPNVINTAENQTFAWWKVDLETQVQDATVRIYFRVAYTWRRNGVKLYTYTRPFPESNPTSQGQLCDTVTGKTNGSDIPDVVSVTCPGRWRYLLLFTDTDNDGDGPVLDFGEVEVMVCSNGTYGDDCLKTCETRHCVTMATTCAGDDGRCPDGCKAGWTGVDCTQDCPAGKYGEECKSLCNEGCDPSKCDSATGTCTGHCMEGWTGHNCVDQCPSDRYGRNCGYRCSAGCEGSVCNRSTGACPVCVEGWRHADNSLRCDREEENGAPCSYLLIASLVASVLVVLIVGLAVATFNVVRLRQALLAERNKVYESTRPVAGNVEEHHYIEVHDFNSGQ